MKVWAEREAEDFLQKNKFKVAPRNIVDNEKDLMKTVKKLGIPIVLKVSGTLHKSDKGGVKGNLHTDKELLKAFRELKKLSKEIMVHKQIDGLGVLAGIKKDPTFGHVLVFGMGGIYTEQMKDVSFRVCPVNPKDIKQMMKETKILN